MTTYDFFDIEPVIDHISLVLGLNGHMDKCEEVEKIRCKLMHYTEEITVEEAERMIKPYRDLANSIKLDDA